MSSALSGVVKFPPFEMRFPRSAATGLRQRARSIEFSTREMSVARGATSAPLGRADPIEAIRVGAGPSEESSVIFSSYLSLVRISRGTTTCEAAVCPLPLRTIWAESTPTELAAI